MEQQVEIHKPNQIAAWLAQRSPIEVDKALRLQASRLGVGLTVRYDGATPTRCDAQGSLTQLDAVKLMIRRAMQHAEPSQIEGWLAELSVIAPSRKEDGFTAELKLAAYTGRLGAYPADVVRAALLSHRWPFWPSWAELAAVCDRLVTPRLVMLAAKVPDPEIVPVEPRNPDAIAAIVASFVTAKRMTDLRRTPMATTFDAAETIADGPPAPHWSETAPPEDPRWGQLRASRATSMVVRPAAMVVSAAEADNLPKESRKNDPNEDAA